MDLDLMRRGLKKGFLVNRKGQVSWKKDGAFCCGIGIEPDGNCGEPG